MYKYIYVLYMYQNNQIRIKIAEYNDPVCGALRMVVDAGKVPKFLVMNGIKI